MTKERIRASDEALPVKPVTEWDNNGCNGLALCHERVFQQTVAEAKDLRNRQKAYLDSLPTDPPEVIRAARDLMQPDAERYPDGIEEALHLSYALEALVNQGDLDAQGRVRDAALYITRRVSFAMHRAATQLDRMSDILGNPARIERDTR